VLKKNNFIIVVHEFVPQGGPAYETLQYLLKKNAGTILFIAHPLLSTPETYANDSRYDYFKKGKKVEQYRSTHLRLPDLLLFIKDFLLTLLWCVQYKNNKYDVFIGLDPLNALAGIVLRTMGIVDKVIYYSIDYFPTRFNNAIMNSLYHFIDKLSVRFSNETWNVGINMKEARARFNNMKGYTYTRQYYVPIGIWFDKEKMKPIEKIDTKKLVYAGHLISYMGIDLAIRAMPELIKKIPGISLDIIGMGAEEKDLKDLTKQLSLTKQIHFYSWMGDRKSFEEKLSTAAVGLATFNTIILDDKVKNADPSKIKDYMVCGLPIITTNALATYKDVENAKAAIVVDYNQKAFIKAVVSLLGNKQTLDTYRHNAQKFVQQFDWEVLLNKNMQRLFGS